MSLPVLTAGRSLGPRLAQVGVSPNILGYRLCVMRWLTRVGAVGDGVGASVGAVGLAVGHSVSSGVGAAVELHQRTNQGHSE
jgi:hypothetical protein